MDRPCGRTDELVGRLELADEHGRVCAADGDRRLWAGGDWLEGVFCPVFQADLRREEVGGRTDLVQTALGGEDGQQSVVVLFWLWVY